MKNEMVWIKKDISSGNIKHIHIDEMDLSYLINILAYISKSDKGIWFGYCTEDWIIALNSRIEHFKLQRIKNINRIKRLKERKIIIDKISDLIVNEILYTKRGENKFTFCKLLIQRENSMLSTVEDIL